jgi:hypothetical protein
MVKARKEGKMQKYSFAKGLEKFLRGAGVALVAAVVALLIDKDEATVKEVIESLGNTVLVALPVIGGLIDATINAIKFFTKKNKGGE